MEKYHIVNKFGSKGSPFILTSRAYLRLRCVYGSDLSEGSQKTLTLQMLFGDYDFFEGMGVEWNWNLIGFQQPLNMMYIMKRS